MTRFLPLVLVAAGCGGALSASLTAASPAPAGDVFTCVREQIRPLGYTQVSHDVEELRLTARRIDATVRRPDVRFRRVIDQLTVEIDPAEGGGTSLTVEAATYGEYATHRGFDLEQERPSEGVTAAAQALVDGCGK